MTEMADDLVRRLRRCNKNGAIHGQLRHEAADRIEALTAERDEAKAMQECGCAYENPTDICAGHHALFERVYGVQRAALEARLDATKDKAEAALIDLMPKLAKAVELLKEARQDLEFYVTHEWPKDEHPVYERKWHRDMELCRRIDATLAEIEGER
jgi:hypothetical protein